MLKVDKFLDLIGSDLKKAIKDRLEVRIERLIDDGYTREDDPVMFPDIRELIVELVDDVGEIENLDVSLSKRTIQNRIRKALVAVGALQILTNEEFLNGEIFVIMASGKEITTVGAYCRAGFGFKMKGQYYDLCGIDLDTDYIDQELVSLLKELL